MYVALKRQRFGDAMLDVGDEVPHEPGRNFNLMVRQGLVADLASKERSEEAHVRTVSGYKSRITKLENDLADAHAEIAKHRKGASKPASKSKPARKRKPASKTESSS